MKTAIALERLHNQLKTILSLLGQTRLKDNTGPIITKINSLIKSASPTDTEINKVITDILSLIDQDMQRISIPANASIFLDHFASLYQVIMTFLEMEDITVANRTHTENIQKTIVNKSKLAEQTLKDTGIRIIHMYSEQEQKDQFEYRYEENDINTILKARFKEEADKPGSYLALHRSSIHLIPCTGNEKLDDGKPEWFHSVKSAVREHTGQTGTLLIPYNQGREHWVGLVLAFDNKGKITTLQYMNSMSSQDEMHKIHALLQSEKLLSTEFNKDFNCVNLTLLRQDDRTTCGAYTIENLLIAAQNLHTTPPLSSAQVRELHLSCLKQHNPKYYHDGTNTRGEKTLGFYGRQLYNIPTVVNTQQPAPTLKQPTTAVQQFKLITELVEIIKQCQPENKKTLSEAFLLKQGQSPTEYQQKLKKAFILPNIIPVDPWPTILEERLYNKNGTLTIDNSILQYIGAQWKQLILEDQSTVQHPQKHK